MGCPCGRAAQILQVLTPQYNFTPHNSRLALSWLSPAQPRLDKLNKTGIVWANTGELFSVWDDYQDQSQQWQYNQSGRRNCCYRGWVGLNHHRPWSLWWSSTNSLAIQCAGNLAQTRPAITGSYYSVLTPPARGPARQRFSSKVNKDWELFAIPRKLKAVIAAWWIEPEIFNESLVVGELSRYCFVCFIPQLAKLSKLIVLLSSKNQLNITD